MGTQLSGFKQSFKGAKKPSTSKKSLKSSKSAKLKKSG